jgi:tRNA-2-methylthio-N6-dimethylallyladenosine synthase
MNRGHTRAEFLDVIRRLQAACPQISFTSDFIVGFPGETSADFAATLALVREVNYAQAFSFKYSPRPGTPASAAKMQVPEEVKDERLQALQALLREQQDAFNAACEGRTFPVLFEKPGRKPGQAVGRSPYLQPVHAEGTAHLIGHIAQVRVEEALPNSLRGTLVREKAPAH